MDLGNRGKELREAARELIESLNVDHLPNAVRFEQIRLIQQALNEHTNLLKSISQSVAEGAELSPMHDGALTYAEEKIREAMKKANDDIREAIKKLEDSLKTARDTNDDIREAIKKLEDSLKTVQDTNVGSVDETIDVEIPHDKLAESITVEIFHNGGVEKRTLTRKQATKMIKRIFRNHKEVSIEGLNDDDEAVFDLYLSKKEGEIHETNETNTDQDAEEDRSDRHHPVCCQHCDCISIDEDEEIDEEDYDDEDCYYDDEDEGEDPPELEMWWIEYLKSNSDHEHSELIAPETYFFYPSLQNNMYEKYEVREDESDITLVSTANGVLGDIDVIKEFLTDETDYYSCTEDILVLNEGIERVVVLDHLDAGHEEMEAYLVITKDPDMNIAARSEESYYQYVLNDDGSVADWAKDKLNKDVIAESILEFLSEESGMDFHVSELPAGILRNFLTKGPDRPLEVENPTPGEHIREDGDMSPKNIDDAKAAGGAIGNGKRYVLVDAPRFNRRIAYVDFGDKKFEDGSLPIHFGHELLEEHPRYDDFEIRVLTDDASPRQIIITDNQVVRELTDYLQMTEDDEFNFRLITLIQWRKDSINVGARRTLVLVPDSSANSIVMAFKRRGETQLEVLAADLNKVAGGKRGMSAYLDMDVLGGYILGRSK